MKVYKFWIISILVMLIITVLTYYFLFSNIDMAIKRIVYFSSGLAGHFMIERYVPESNKSKKEGFWIIAYWFYVLFVAPMWLAIGIIAFIRTKIKLLK